MRATKRRSLALLMAAALLGSLLGYDHAPAVAGEEVDPSRLVVADIPDRDDGPSHPRLDRALAALEDRTRRGPPLDRQIAAAETVRVIIKTLDGRGANVALRMRSLEAHGVITIESQISGTITGATLAVLAADPEVVSVRSAIPAHPDGEGEGVQATNADEWHTAGYLGSNTKIAVIDVGFHDYTTLPTSVITMNFGCPQFTGHPHGTAVAEIVHEMAPDATLYLMCIPDNVGFDQAVQASINSEVDVINFSAGFYAAGRGDGSGLLEASLDAAKAAGILFVASAGNSATEHWGGEFLDKDDDGWHEFSPDTPNDPSAISVPGEAIPFSVSPGSTITSYLKWDDWPTTSIDLDIRLGPAPGGIFNDSGTSYIRQPLAEPWERASYTNQTSGSQTVYLLVEYKSGDTSSVEIDIFAVRRALPSALQVPSRSLIDPAVSPDVTAVGAYCWETEDLRSYSSQGPTIDNRHKPDLSGPDGVSSIAYGSFVDCPSQSGFAGTSASAPHVAGAAALLLNACPLLSSGNLTEYLDNLTESAGSGTANTHGAGRLKLGDPTATTTQEWCAEQSDDPPPDDPPPEDPPPEEPLPNDDPSWFTDVAGHEFEEAMLWMGSTNISKGCNPPANTMFCPDRLLKRSEMATFLRNMLGLSQSNNDGLFTDHLENTHRKNINAIRIAGLTVGCNPPANTRYCPNGTLTRAEIATFIARAFNLKHSGTMNYTDISSHWGKNPINAVADAGIAWPCDTDGRFCPNAQVDRAEMAQWIYRAWQEGYLP